jgi:serine protease Do
MPAMVSITNTVVEETDSAYYGTQEYESEGVASGIIIAQNEDELLIATNSHVVEDSTDIKVWFNVDAEREDDLCADGKIKGMDKNYELAVVAVRLEDIPEEILSQIRIATIGSSSSLKVGQTAIAISNQLGYGQSVTCGVISALNLDVELDSLKVPLLLMDTPINSGSSGGAVLDAQGCLIGIAVAKETGDGSESMSYAIPVDEAVPVLERLMNRETRDKLSDSERGYIGATVVNVNDDAKELYNMPEGAFVYEVSEGSAAEAAGIRRGDIITAFAGESVTSSSDLIDKISYYAAGETVVIELQTANDGKYETREVEVTLQAGTDVEDDDADADSSASEDDGSDQSQDGEEDWGEYGEIPGDSDDQEFGNLPYGFGSDEMY